MPDPQRGVTLGELADDGGNSWSLANVLSALGNVRYGVSTEEKERLARSGSLPGSPTANTADAAEADRYAAGYLFAKEHPWLSQYIQPAVDRLKVSTTPVFGGSSPELQSYATAGSNAGRLAAENEERLRQQRGR